MFKKQILLLGIAMGFLIPLELEAKRIFKRRWSLSMVNAYTFYQFPHKKFSQRSNYKWEDPDGSMHPTFSSLEISRNFNNYEVGAKIQNSGPIFVSPFITWNLNGNKGHVFFIPAITMGVLPHTIIGSWLRLGLGFSINPYMSFTPFIALSTYYKLNKNPGFEKYNLHFNTGFKVNLYY